MSWAAVARQEAVPCQTRTDNWAVERPRVAVVDANAIISGLTLAGIAERAVTIQVCFSLAVNIPCRTCDDLPRQTHGLRVQEVVGEIRDKKSREWLQALPYRLDIMEPCDESVKAGSALSRLPLTL